MATDAAITAAISAATNLAITPAQMVALIDRAIASGMTEDGRVVLSVNSRGTAISFGSMADAISARRYYKEMAVSADGGLTASPCEMVSG